MGNALKDCVQARWILCFMLFLGMMSTFMLRVNISLAIVSMVNTTAVAPPDEFQPNGTASCERTTDPLDTSVTSEDVSAPAHGGEFEWDELQQSVVLSSFFWGYLLFQVPGGRVAEIYGTKRVFGGAICLNGILSLLLPLAAKLHWTILLIIRAAQGLAQGVLFPALSAAVAQWVPLHERARFIGFAVQGASLGLVVSLPLCGAILNAWGWEAVFYVSGLLALAWSFSWMFLAYDTPLQHPRITTKERTYILDNIQQQKNREEEGSRPVPWRSVLTCLQFWIGCIAAFGNDWGFHMFTTLIPKYISSSLGFDLKKSSWLTSLPFLCQYVFAMVYGAAADAMLRRGVPLVRVRKLSVVVSHLMPATALVGLSLAGCDITLSIFLLTSAVALVGAFSSGFYQNPLDIAPNFAGSLTGIMNGIGSIAGIISTPIAGVVLQSSGSAGWPIIILIAAGMYALCSLPYLLLADCKVQQWNDEEPHPTAIPMVNALPLSNKEESQSCDEKLEDKIS